MLILLSAVYSFISISAQITDFADKEQKAHSAFINGKYEQALYHYHELRDLFQQNPDYHYYIGRCLMELDNDAIETIDNLRFAAVKGEQKDAWFFLGRAYHLNADYEKAVYAYKRYLKLGKRSAVKRLNVKEALVLAESKSSLSPGKNHVFTEKADVADTEEVKQQTDETNRIPSSPESKNSNVTETEQEDAKVVYNDVDMTKALDLQLLADSFNRTAKIKRAGLKETEVTEYRNRLISEISQLEKDSHKIQREADKLFESMQKDTSAEYSDDTVKSHEFIELKEEINGIKVYQYKTENLFGKEASASQETDTSIKVDKEDDDMEATDKDLFFTGKKIYSVNQPIPPRILYPDKLVYHIQLGVFSKKIDPGSFGAIAPICYEEIENRGLFKYYAGLFFTYKSADEAHVIIKSRGFPDSFIVAFHKGEQISVERARQIEYVQIKF